MELLPCPLVQPFGSIVTRSGDSAEAYVPSVSSGRFPMVSTAPWCTAGCSRASLPANRVIPANIADTLVCHMCLQALDCMPVAVQYASAAHQAASASMACRRCLTACATWRTRGAIGPQCCAPGMLVFPGWLQSWASQSHQVRCLRCAAAISTVHLLPHKRWPGCYILVASAQSSGTGAVLP